jgi:hypothetical protein
MPPKKHLTMPKIHIARQIPNKELAKITFTSMIVDSVVELPAFIGNFSQTFSPIWNKEKVFGRMDEIATYQGTTRTISVSLVVPSRNRTEAKYTLEACNRLISMVYPKYRESLLSKPPLIRMEFVNLIKGNIVTQKEGTETTRGVTKESNRQVKKVKKGEDQKIVFNEDAEGGVVGGNSISAKQGGLLGWIDNLSWTVQPQNGFTIHDKNLYPNKIDLSFTFNVLHEETLDQEMIRDNRWPFGGDYKG